MIKAVWELAADIGGLLRLDVACELERERVEAAIEGVLECEEMGEDVALLSGQRPLLPRSSIGETADGL